MTLKRWAWPRDALIDALRSVMRRGTSYERDEDTKLAATHLGFKRVGKKVDEASARPSTAPYAPAS